MLGWHQRIFTCKKCEFKTRDVQQFRGHAHIVNCKLCEFFTDSDKDLRDHVHRMHEQQPISAKKYWCGLCPKKCVSKTLVLNHFLDHHRNFGCLDCKKLFKFKRGLNLHQQEAHGYADLTCSECKKQLNDNLVLVEHIEKEHKMITLEKCSVCKMAFKDEASRMEHNDKAHKSGHEFIQCNAGYCRMKFLTQDQMTKHLELVHEKVQHKCPVGDCHGVYPTRHFLEKHFIKNHDTKCDKCDHESKSLTEYQKHTKTHLNNEKAGPAYKCGKCEFTAIRLYDMTKHENEVHKNFNFKLPTPQKLIEKANKLNEEEQTVNSEENNSKSDNKSTEDSTFESEPSKVVEEIEPPSMEMSVDFQCFYCDFVSSDEVKVLEHEKVCQTTEKIPSMDFE